MLPKGYVVRKDDLGDHYIPTATGEIYLYSSLLLGVQIFGHPRIAGTLKRLGYVAEQDGDDEWTFLVPLDELPHIASIVKPRRKRTLRYSAEELAKRTARLPQNVRTSTGSTESVLAL